MQNEQGYWTSNKHACKLTKDNDIIDKENRKINTKTVRNMVVLGHCKFVERLITKAEQFTNVNVYVISEEYTSQKCLKCKKNTKTGNELYTCKSCSFTIDRDIYTFKELVKLKKKCKIQPT